MHVLMIPSWYRTRQQPLGGVFFREQAHVLREAGYRMGVVAPAQYSIRMAPGRLGRGYRAAFEDDGGIPTYSSYTCVWLPLPRTNTEAWLRHGMRLVERYLADVGRPDLVHAQAAFQAGLLAERVHERWGIPYVISEHASLYQERRIRPWQMPLLRRALAGASARTAVSPRLGEALEGYFGPAVIPWTWVPNMVNPRFLDAPLGRRRSGTAPFRFLHVALLEPIKAHDDLLGAFADRFRGDAGVELRIGGDGLLRPWLERLAGRMGVRDQVRLLGLLTREQVIEEMLAADAVVLSSRFETFSVVLAEALACGTPVVSTACGGPECIVNESNGLLVPTRDVRALGEAMVAMRRRAGEYDPEALRRDCAERFGCEAVLAKWRRVYDEAVGPSRNS